MSMQIDAEFKKEQNGTLFCLVGALEGGFWGWVVPQGCPPQNVNVPSKNKNKHPPARGKKYVSPIMVNSGGKWAVKWSSQAAGLKTCLSQVVLSRYAPCKMATWSHLSKFKIKQGYMCLWGASERKLGKSLKPNQKDIRTNQGKRAGHSATKEATPQISG
jgi:hypothetical protein